MPVPSNLFAFNNPSVACIVDCLLKSANVDDLPVEQATKFDLVINLNIAKALGVTIPSSLLAHLRLSFSRAAILDAINGAVGNGLSRTSGLSKGLT